MFYRGFKRIAHDNENSIVVDQIEIDVPIPDRRAIMESPWY